MDVSFSRAGTASLTNECRLSRCQGAAPGRHRALSRHALAARRSELSVSAELLGLCARGHRHEWGVEGRLARVLAPLPLSPLGRCWRRSRARPQRRAPPVRAVALRALDRHAKPPVTRVSKPGKSRGIRSISYLRWYAGVRGAMACRKFP